MVVTHSGNASCRSRMRGTSTKMPHRP
jgi:hypothetical protein